MVKTGGGHVLVVQQSKDTETSVPSETIGCSNLWIANTVREYYADVWNNTDLGQAVSISVVK